MSQKPRRKPRMKGTCWNCKKPYMRKVKDNPNDPWSKTHYEEVYDFVKMRPVYINYKSKKTGKRTWLRIGFYCPQCEGFDNRNPERFEKHRRAI